MNINPDTVMKIMQLFEKATEMINTTAEKIEKFNEKLSSKNVDNQQLPPTVNEKIEFLKMDNIRSIAKAHRPVAANEVVAYFVKKPDFYLIILTYSKDRSILPNESNKMLFIEAEGISREVENLFINDKVIILK